MPPTLPRNPVAWRRARAGALVSAIALMTALPAAGQQHLTGMGPVDPQTNFPTWFQDHTGLALRLCTANNDQSGLCLYDPIDPADTATLPYQQQIGFNAEGFWWTADAQVGIAPSAACPTCAGGQLVLAVEAAFNQEKPVKGDEFTFGRIRIRIDAPFAGRYRVTHPFGSEVFAVDAPGVKAINATNDIGTISPDYTGPLKSNIAAFLKWDPAVAPAAPPGYIGDPTQPHKVVGSPNGTNLFRIEYLDGPVNLDGNGNNFVQTDLFLVSGLIHDGQVPTPASVNRASFSQGRAELFVRSAPGATVTARFDQEATETPLVGDGQGGFYLVVNRSQRPGTATIIAKAAGTLTTTLVQPVLDVVTITKAEYDPASKGLSVSADSSDNSATPTLSVQGYGNLNAGNWAGTVAVPPATVTVLSSAGGKDEEPVRVVAASGPGEPGGGEPPPPPPPPPANAAPVAVADSAQVVIGTPTTIPVTANDTDSDGTVEAATVTIVQQPTKGTIGLIGLPGVTYTPNAGLKNVADSFTYQVRDNSGALSNVATVSLSIIPEQLALTSATWRATGRQWRITGTSNARTANTITAYLVVETRRLQIGSAQVGADGSYDIRVDNSVVGPLTGATVTVRSSRGTEVSNQPIIRN